MNLFIDNKSGSPIYDQIFTQMKSHILTGVLPEGALLPSIRALAKDLRISVITTKRAYDELEREGYIYGVAGKGFFVAKRNPSLVYEEGISGIQSLRFVALVLFAFISGRKRYALPSAPRYAFSPSNISCP